MRDGGGHRDQPNSHPFSPFFELLGSTTIRPMFASLIKLSLYHFGILLVRHSKLIRPRCTVRLLTLTNTRVVSPASTLFTHLYRSGGLRSSSPSLLSSNRCLPHLFLRHFPYFLLQRSHQGSFLFFPPTSKRFPVSISLFNLIIHE